MTVNLLADYLTVYVCHNNIIIQISLLYVYSYYASVNTNTIFEMKTRRMEKSFPFFIIKKYFNTIVRESIANIQ